MIFKAKHTDCHMAVSFYISTVLIDHKNLKIVLLVFWLVNLKRHTFYLVVYNQSNNMLCQLMSDV